LPKITPEKNEYGGLFIFFTVYELFPQFVVIFRNKVIWWILAILLFPSIGYASPRYSAKNGILDLSAWNGEEFIKLDGQWEFYWNEFLPPDKAATRQEKMQYMNVPSGWNDHKYGNTILPMKGYATFHLRVVNIPRMENLAFQTNGLSTAYSLMVNGKEISRNGQIGKSSMESIPAYHPQTTIVPLEILKKAPGQARGRMDLDITVHVSNYHDRKGGITRQISMGSYDTLNLRFIYKTIIDTILFGIILIMGLYHINLYVHHQKDLSWLYFGFFAVLIAFRTMVTGDRLFYYIYPQFPWALGMKVEFLSFYLTVPLFAAYLYHLFPKDFNRFVHKLVFGLGLVFSLIVVVTNPIFFTRTVKIYQVVSLLIAGYLFIVLGTTIYRRREGSIILLVGALILITGVLNDIAYHNYLIKTMEIGSYGVGLFILSHSYLLSRRYVSTFKMKERLAENLKTQAESFHRFVPTQFLELIGKDINNISSGDSRGIQMSVLFSDIRSYTTLSERMTVEDNFKFLNSYLRRIEPIIEKYNGFVDKFIGDAVMALYHGDWSGASALDSAIEVQRQITIYNMDRAKANYPLIHLGIGINTGFLMIGTIGSSNRLDTTVIGDTVNLTSRMENLTKIYEADILISDNTYKNLENPDRYYIREIDSIRVKGKERPTVIYEVFDTNPDDQILLKNQYAGELMSAILHYKSQNFFEAMKIILAIEKINPSDRLIQIYKERIRLFMEDPPGEKWDGVFKMEKIV